MFFHFTIRSRLVFVIGFLSMLLVAGGVIGLTSLAAANDVLKTSYENRLVPLDELDRVVRLVNRNQLAVAQALTAGPAAIAAEMDAVEKRVAEADILWRAYREKAVSPQERKLAESVEAARLRFVEEGLKPASAALRANDLPQPAAR